jgi:thiol-disulfide isomerase/thioredoxin
MLQRIIHHRWTKHLPALFFLGVISYLFFRSYVYLAPRTVDLATLDLHSLDSRPVPTSVFHGKPVVLNFWAPWCPPCREEIPRLEHLQQQNPNVAVIGLEDDSNAVQQSRDLVRRSPISYTLVLPSQTLHAKFGQVAGLPTTLYLSASGKIVHTVTGIVPENVMQHYLRDAIAAR